MKIVDNPSALFRSYSVWGMVAGVLVLAQEIVPVWEGIVSEGTFTIMGAAAVSMGIVGRFIDQGIANVKKE